MDVKVGDRIAVETERVGQAGREGEVLEVLEIVEGAAVSLRVHWDDGHESIFTPSAGAVRIVSAKR